VSGVLAAGETQPGRNTRVGCSFRAIDGRRGNGRFSPRLVALRVFYRLEMARNGWSSWSLWHSWQDFRSVLHEVRSRSSEDEPMSFGTLRASEHGLPCGSRS
jgi:hypothetical protein